ncbi:MAG: hypothetical protein QG671_4182 [Actinomycetota bacterium]|nr:hypothetical protein [Actinomycetota bacterium]
MTTDAPARWRPARAGILNVYQYEDETLHFADGRLLLRGVNGSGKSTAMNMLLPFLLEADTRRIDAAGEQTGVLTSWMLADNDDTQRTGYLWLEFARRDPTAPDGLLHHAVGCGIRANRSTNRTTSWWFSTPRRPRIDFCLTINRVRGCPRNGVTGRTADGYRPGRCGSVQSVRRPAPAGRRGDQCAGCFGGSCGDVVDSARVAGEEAVREQ